MSNLNTNTHWAEAARRLQRAGEDYVLVTVLGVRGSTPRDSGTKMVFSSGECFGTIGGGHLEYQTAAIAAGMLSEEHEEQRLEYFPLGPSLGQCCGGSTSVLFESFKAPRMDIMLFGAGHVGSALVPILKQLPCRLRWVDSRESGDADTADVGVDKVCSDEPAAEVQSMPAGSYFLIMTHNHQLDYEILCAALKRKDAAYVGMIGSQTKWRRFQMRLQHQGYSADFYSAVHCPIGLDQVPGKRPIEVAVSVAGELIGIHNEISANRPVQQGPTRAELQPLIEQLKDNEPV
jgi:xanthine dehydrogenase accessory factor